MLKQVEVDLKNRQLQKTVTLLERFLLHGDLERADKAKKLIKKIHDHEFITAFCGHFSAGKSTMINALIGDQVLPSSPIPTSANLVNVHRSDEDYAKIYYQTEKPLLFKGAYDFETVKDFCKNGDVVEVEIGKVDTLLPDGVTVMDTPGVDSTDDAHRISTESALHLADLVFYVMDYNHVQSELNFMYTKNLLKHGVKLYLIINQIDKHNEAELSFSEFKQSVYESFASWNVQPEGMFFTTLKATDHQENEFAAVKQLIDDALRYHDQWLNNTIDAAFDRMEEEHRNWLDEQKAEAIAPYDHILASYSKEELAHIFEKETELRNEFEKYSNKANDLEKQFELERTQLLKNAYLMPAETRELAEQFLLAAQVDFKVGLLFSKKKTETERSSRLQNFAVSVRKQIESQLEWHMRQMAAQFLVQAQLADDDLQVAAQQLSVPFQDQRFTELIKKGAGVTGQSVLNYCNDVANDVKKVAEKEIDQLIGRIISVISEQIKGEKAALQKELSDVTKATDAVKQIAELELFYVNKQAMMTAQTGNEEERLNELRVEWKHAEKNVRFYSESAHKKSVEEREKQMAAKQEQEIQTETIPINDVIKKLDHAVSYLQNEQSFERMTAQLMQRAKHLKEKNYTIALFGAFSAGKSSFANALLGENVLPVSPNPTTAAINRICPPNAENRHGTANVRLKTVEQMGADIRQSLQMFGFDCHSLADAYTIIPNVLATANTEGAAHIHLSFLAAFHQGYEQFHSQLGTTITTDLTDFRQFVANESQSCFVETIDLYYDCSFTKQGITLVDTPGADSINARHTGVAFDYIKNSDAILFVTYYNHAFSKADREFLIQLGRVKDAFELDKMFFIVNAIDLAYSNAEVDEVLHYVEDQLNEYGIRFPRIFGVSSKLAQQCEGREASNIAQFEQAFHHFLESDLQKMAVQAAEASFHRAVSVLEQLIATASEDESEKERRKAELIDTRERVKAWLLEAQLGTLTERMTQEIEELLYYVKQRVFYRFPDFFKEAFNPALLTSNQRHLLKKALEELLAATSYDFVQEMRATSLRVERFISKRLVERFQLMERELHSLQAELSLSSFEWESNATLPFQAPFSENDQKQLEGTFKYFKNPKAFFEKNEKKRMEEALQQSLSPLADTYIDNELEHFKTHFGDLLEQRFTEMIASIQTDVEDQYNVMLAAFDHSDKLDDWVRIRDGLIGLEKKEE